jgi:DNA repair protein RadC
MKDANPFLITFWSEDCKPLDKLMLKDKSVLSDVELLTALIG